MWPNRYYITRAGYKAGPIVPGISFEYPIAMPVETPTGTVLHYYRFDGSSERSELDIESLFFPKTGPYSTLDPNSKEYHVIRERERFMELYRNEKNKSAGLQMKLSKTFLKGVFFASAFWFVVAGLVGVLL